MNIPTVSIENIEELKVIYVRFRGTYIEFRKHVLAILFYPEICNVFMS